MPSALQSVQAATGFFWQLFHSVTSAGSTEYRYSVSAAYRCGGSPCFHSESSREILTIHGDSRICWPKTGYGEVLQDPVHFLTHSILSFDDIQSESYQVSSLRLRKRESYFASIRRYRSNCCVQVIGSSELTRKDVRSPDLESGVLTR
jgi:hypothetical protein